MAVMGFSPGFAYLDGLPEPLRGVPRRATPRPVVPAGSVALANGYAAVYPTASPGGWQLVGRTASSFFSPVGPALCRAGARRPVQLVETGATDDVGRRYPASRPPGRRRTGPARFRGGGPGAARRAPGRWPARRGGHRCSGRRSRRSGVVLSGQPARGQSAPGAGALEITAGTARLRCLERVPRRGGGRGPDVRLDGMPATGRPGGAAARRARLVEVGPLRAGPARLLRRGGRAARTGGLRSWPATS